MRSLLVLGGVLGAVILLFDLWGRWDAWQRGRRTAATNATFSEITADLHDVFPEEH